MASLLIVYDSTAQLTRNWTLIDAILLYSRVKDLVNRLELFRYCDKILEDIAENYLSAEYCVTQGRQYRAPISGIAIADECQDVNKNFHVWKPHRVRSNSSQLLINEIFEAFEFT